jgi:hypothetical protein
MSSIQLKVTAYVLTMLALVGMCGLVVAWARSTGGNGGRLRSTSADVGTTVEWGNKVKPEEPKDYENRILVQFSESQRFGIVCPKLRDPRNLEEPKRLTRDARGITNNTCVRIDGYEYLYGIEIPGVRYVRERGKVQKERPIPGKDKDRAWQSTMDVEFTRIRVNQSVELVVGENTRLYDTALVKYHVQNLDKVPHTVGLRVMLDTFIGANDGVPFYLPPTEDTPARLVETMAILNQKQIPEYLQALEDMNDKGATVAILCPKIKGCEPMEKLVLCRWPQNSEARWGFNTTAAGDWLYEPMDKNPHAKDSCVLMYWAQVTMRPGEQRTLAFTYGLGRIASESEDGGSYSGRMRLFVGARRKVNRPITVAALIKSTDPKQTVTLKVPAGLTLAPGYAAEQKVPPPLPAGYSQVTWRLIGKTEGEYLVAADAPNIGVASEKLYVRPTSIFDED